MNKVFFGTAIALGLLCNACGRQDAGSKGRQDKYEQAKESIEEIEEQSPAKFITATQSDKKNLLGQRVVKGKVTNNARMAIFKDVELKIAFYSKTGVLLQEESETIYETLPPGATTTFKSKFFAAKGTDSVAIKVVGAQPVSAK